jgi:hypothetical protein
VASRRPSASASELAQLIRLDWVKLIRHHEKDRTSPHRASLSTSTNDVSSTQAALVTLLICWSEHVFEDPKVCREPNSVASGLQLYFVRRWKSIVRRIKAILAILRIEGNGIFSSVFRIALSLIEKPLIFCFKCLHMIYSRIDLLSRMWFGLWQFPVLRKSGCVRGFFATLCSGQTKGNSIGDGQQHSLKDLPC